MLSSTGQDILKKGRFKYQTGLYTREEFRIHRRQQIVNFLTDFEAHMEVRHAALGLCQGN